MINESDSVPVFFIPNVNIWLASETSTFYFRKNLDQEVDLKVSDPSVLNKSE